jgi:Polyketide cyclase / dehydrase and lipid transport
MKSLIEVEIDMPLEEVAELFADPRNNPKWMHDVKSYEPITGEQGMPGSTYRLVPKEGDLIFLATVVERNLPHTLRVNLEGSTVDVAMTGTIQPLSPTRTKLISEEEFTFKDSENATVDSSVKEAIKAAHRRHIEDFKRFAEHHE